MMDAAATLAPTTRKAASRFNKGAFYRLCRIWHGYLSAFAFLALIFFAGTGLLLNHPEWFEQAAAARAETSVNLSASAIATARAAADPTEALARLVTETASPRGAYASGEMLDGEAMLRFEGVTGATDVVIDLETGSAALRVSRASPIAILHDLHRGKNAGAVWKGLIDIVSVVVLSLSLIGYVLFFSLRFRLASSLALTVLSAAALIGIFVVFVP